jgi:uncharacterized membrane protein
MARLYHFAMLHSEPRQSAASVLFDARLSPHASLPPAGFALLMAALCTLSFAAGVAFVTMGAWPVFGFFGLDVAALYIAFRISYARARRYETVRLTMEKLAIERVDPRGQIERFEFQPYWLRVLMDDPPRHDSQLVLRSHGRALAIGAFLTPAERLELANALKTALARLRSGYSPSTSAIE